MTDNSHTISFNPGDIYFYRRNNLVKYAKCPPDGGEYQSISIYFDQQTLRNISLEYGYKAERQGVTPAFQRISSSEIGNYMRSLLAYETILKRIGTNDGISKKFLVNLQAAGCKKGDFRKHTI